LSGPGAGRSVRLAGVLAGVAFLTCAVACSSVPRAEPRASAAPDAGAAEPAGRAADTTAAFFDALIARAEAARWDTLAIGERIGRFGLVLEGKPYLDGTLEAPGEESCRITGAGFDCVTFMETCLGLARVTAQGAGEPRDFEGLMAAVTFTRYRGGRIDGYTSRLHYTSDWILENARRGVLRDVTASLGGVAQSPGVGYMSAHPDRYAALKGHPDRVEVMRGIEARLNADTVYVLPKGEVASIESRLQTGDLIAIATSIAGLDYSHTGLVYRDERGVARFLHASSAKAHVVLDAALHEYLANGPKSQTGVTILRPLDASPAARISR